MIALIERGDAVDLVDQPQLQMILQVGADAGRSAMTSMPCSRNCAAGPMPDNSRSCVEPIEPAERMTSPRQSALRVTPFCRQRTPAARLPSKMRPSARQPVFEPQIGAMQHRLEERARRRPTPAAF